MAEVATLKNLLGKLKYQPSATLLAEFEAVQLTPEELANAILEAKRAKWQLLRDQKEQDDRFRQHQELTRQWTGQELAAVAKRRANELVQLSGHPEYIFDEHSRKVFNLLVLYFTNNPEFEKHGDYSLNKGLMLVGNVGVGKTDLLKAFEKNRRRCFYTLTADEIVARVKKHGAQYWESYTGYVAGLGGTPDYFLQPNIGWMIDDVGTDDVVVDFGTRIDPLVNIVAQRYIKKETIPFSSLHITTNLNGAAIDARYGYRFRSRLREMFNFIELSGTDRRK